MKKTYESKCVKVKKGTAATRCQVPAPVRDLLNLKIGDTVQFTIHYLDNNKAYITFNKKKEEE